MKKLIILLSTILYSCTNTVQDKPNIEYYNTSDYVIVEVDSCEYIKFGSGQYKWGGHRGTCKYCKLRNKK